MNWRFFLAVGLLLALLALPFLLGGRFVESVAVPDDREEVIFWHFWGGADQAVVDSVVDRFNRSQDQYFVRAIAMPGNNLQAKLFLSVTGGDPPDLVNQDDPVLADWAVRGVVESMDAIADPEEVSAVREWLLPPARRLSVVEGRMVAVCNGLDIRAMYFNRTALESNDLSPPETISDLDRIAGAFSPDAVSDLVGGPAQGYGYLPDSRRLWAWGYVFGGDFLEEETGKVTLNTPPIRAALSWMQDYARRYGADNIAAFRHGDQSLPGKAFPLLPILDTESVGRYVCLMDGQWRVRDIVEFQKRRSGLGLEVPQFGVCPLPVPTGFENIEPRRDAGWVNGNFFVVPRGAKNSAGGWEFMKFWIGYTDPEEAAKTCSEGGWIPVSEMVIETAKYQEYLDDTPLFRPFVQLARSPNQFPSPILPGASMFRRTVEDVGYEAMMNPDRPVDQILETAEVRIQQHLDRER